METLLGEIPQSACKESIEVTAISGDELRGCDLNSSSVYGHPCCIAGRIEECVYSNVSRIDRFLDSTSSSGSASTSRTPSPNEEDPRLLLPEFDRNRFDSATALNERGIVERMQHLQVRDDLTKTFTEDPSFLPGCLLQDLFRSDDIMNLPVVYSNGWIGDRRDFSYPTQLKVRNPDVVGENPVGEYYFQCEGNNVHLNPNLGIISSDGSVNGYHSKVQYVNPLLDGRFSKSFEGFGCEDSFHIQGKGISSNKCYGNAIEDCGIAENNNGYSEMLQRFQKLRPSVSVFNKKETIYNLAKDQDGCRFLQKKFEEKKAETVDFIFCGVIDHVVELMENPFGNYLMQKLIEICRLEQRMKIILKLTEQPSEIIRISLNTHGTRAVQKLIETIKTREEILLVIYALRPGSLQLIKDPNGNHVVQKCLLSLTAEDNKFIFDAATKHCVDIATHRHGCCVLQCCLSHSIGDQNTKLLFEICSNGLLLARDAFGNYVIQYILDLDNQAANAILLSQFKGNFVDLSTQKFSSNVVEKCLKVLSEDEKIKIIAELLRKETLEQLLQDPYANYVIQSALLATKGSVLHASLVHAIRPFAAKLKTNPYCRRIFSKVLRNGH